MDQGEFNAVVLRMLDEYRHARIQTNSPTDHLWAIHEHLEHLMGCYGEIHQSVHGKQPEDTPDEPDEPDEASSDSSEAATDDTQSDDDAPADQAPAWRVGPGGRPSTEA